MIAVTDQEMREFLAKHKDLRCESTSLKPRAYFLPFSPSLNMYLMAGL
jgi:hypothetical protein